MSLSLSLGCWVVALAPSMWDSNFRTLFASTELYLVLLGINTGCLVNAVENFKVIAKPLLEVTRTDPSWASKGISECSEACLSSSKWLSTFLPLTAWCGRQTGWQAEPDLSRGAGEGWPTSHRFPNATLSKAMFPFSHSHSVSFKPHWTPTGVKKVFAMNVTFVSRTEMFRGCHCHHSDWR